MTSTCDFFHLCINTYTCIFTAGHTPVPSNSTDVPPGAPTSPVAPAPIKIEPLSTPVKVLDVVNLCESDNEDTACASTSDKDLENSVGKVTTRFQKNVTKECSVALLKVDHMEGQQQSKRGYGDTSNSSEEDCEDEESEEFDDNISDPTFNWSTKRTRTRKVYNITEIY